MKRIWRVCGCYEMLRKQLEKAQRKEVSNSSKYCRGIGRSVRRRIKIFIFIISFDFFRIPIQKRQIFSVFRVKLKY